MIAVRIIELSNIILHTYFSHIIHTYVGNFTLQTQDYRKITGKCLYNSNAEVELAIYKYTLLSFHIKTSTHIHLFIHSYIKFHGSELHG